MWVDPRRTQFSTRREGKAVVDWVALTEKYVPRYMNQVDGRQQQKKKTGKATKWTGGSGVPPRCVGVVVGEQAGRV
jgi:hypothetical protein